MYHNQINSESNHTQAYAYPGRETQRMSLLCAVRRPSADGGGIVIMPVRLPLPLINRHRAITIMFVEHSVIVSCRRLLFLFPRLTHIKMRANI